ALPPLPPFPLFCLPRFCLWTAFLTSSPAFFPYLAIAVAPEVRYRRSEAGIANRAPREPSKVGLARERTGIFELFEVADVADFEGGGHATEVDANAAVVVVAHDHEGIDRGAVGEEEDGSGPCHAA